MVSTILDTSTELDDVPMPERLRMTYDEYVGWYDKEAGRRGEWVDGEVIVFMSTTFLHDEIVMFLGTLLNAILRRRRAGVVVGTTYELRTREGTAREPDLMVILTEHRDRITNQRLVGAADLVVEVISADSVSRDREVKFDEYEAVGIPEYWIVDPRRGSEAIDLFVLDERGEYVAAHPDADGRLHSTVVPGVWIDPAWLLADELPDPVDLVLRMIVDALGL